MLLVYDDAVSADVDCDDEDEVALANLTALTTLLASGSVCVGTWAL